MPRGAERAPLGHGGSGTWSSGAEIECGAFRALLWRGTSGRAYRDLGGQPEITQDPLDDWGVVGHGDQAQAPVAARTSQDVEAEGPAHQIRPEPAALTPPFRIWRVRAHAGLRLRRSRGGASRGCRRLTHLGQHALDR